MIWQLSYRFSGIEKVVFVIAIDVIWIFDDSFGLSNFSKEEEGGGLVTTEQL